MNIILRKHINRTLVIELCLLSFAICITLLAIISSYQLLVFSEIRFPDIYYEFEGMYLIFLMLCILGMFELVILIHIFGFIKWRKNLPWSRSIFTILLLHIILGILTFCSIKYALSGSNTSELSGVFYIFISLLLFECGIMGFILNGLHKTKEIS